MNSEELERLRHFQLTLAHHSDMYQIIEQRALSLSQQKFHWFVRLQSLLFVAEQVIKDNATREEAEFIAFKLKNALILLINENKPNYVSPLSSLIIHFLKTAPAAVYDSQTPLLFYLQQNCPADFCGVFSYFPVDGASLQDILERAAPDQAQAILANVAEFCAANDGFTGHLETAETNFDIRAVIDQFNQQTIDGRNDQEGQDAESREQMIERDDPNSARNDEQTLTLLQQARNLIDFAPEQQNAFQQPRFESSQASVYIQDLQSENAQLRQKLQEYEQTLRQLSQDTPQTQVYQLQLEAAQIRQAFDQLMTKYQAQKQYVQELQQRAAQYQEKLAQFKLLFDQANQKYEQMKRTANDRIQELRQGAGDSAELAAARAEIEKLRNEKAQLSDITKKLITKLNSK